MIVFSRALIIYKFFIPQLVVKTESFIKGNHFTPYNLTRVLHNTNNKGDFYDV